ncbi:peroxin [Entomortierella lignicola]|nr:peroxin [Entomortierella lignicola]
MLSSVQGFVNRHRRGLAVTAGLTGGIYLMGKYAKNKLIEFQEKSASKRTAEENMKHRFERNQQDCVFTVLALLPTLGDQLLHELNVELITAKLHQNRSQRSTALSTPDGSVILTPKPAESAAVFATSTATTTSVDGEESNEQNKIKSIEEQANGSEKKDDETSTAKEDHTTQENGDKPTANGDLKGHDEDVVIVNGNGKPESDSDPEKEKETYQEEPTVNGSVPEVQVQQEDKEPTESQQTSVSEDTTTQLQKAAQAVVKNEVAVAIDRRVKIELWNELKIMSFTRTVTALYSLTFLTLLTRIQLNLLGRFTYVSSVIALANTTDASYRAESPAVTSANSLLDVQTEKKYLTFSYWLLHDGWRRWSDRVRKVIEEVVGVLSLKKTFNAKEFSALLGEIRAKLEYTEVDGEQVPVNMREYLLPDDPEEERNVLRAGGVDESDLVVDPVLRNLLDETRDFIDSEDFSTVLSSTLATTFARFSLSLQPTFNPYLLSGDGISGSGIQEIENDEDVDRSVSLASLLSLVAKQAHMIINGVPNEYAESLALVKELQAFSAIVYSSFSETIVNY